MNYAQVAKQYQQVNLNSAVASASPHKLISLLLDGFFERVIQAKAAMNLNNTAVKGERISKAMDILTGLRAALDFEQGGEISENLDNLYEYAQRQLMQANLSNNPELLDDAVNTLKPVQEAWRDIAPAV